MLTLHYTCFMLTFVSYYCTGVCIENRNIDYDHHGQTETRRERPLTHDTAESAKSRASSHSSSIMSIKGLASSPHTIVLLVVITVILSISSFFVVFGILQARSSERFCWRHKYEPVPTYYQNGKEKTSMLSKEDYDDEDEIFSA